MIRIGCTGFNEHGSLMQKGKLSLYDYAKYFPIVELDTSFYFIPQEAHIRKWLSEVPENFQFIMKVPGVFTTHQSLEENQSLEELAAEFLSRLQPMMKQKRLFCLLAQFPASFHCSKDNVAYLSKIVAFFPNCRLAIEFRHKSWYDEKWKEQMHAFMKTHHLSLTIVDEPKKLPTTIPLDGFVTSEAFTLIRLHGRNDAGWLQTGKDARAYRTLYNYQEAELEEFRKLIEEVATQSKEVAVIFNNNSGGHAAANAQALQQLLAISYEQLNPKQMSLF